VTINKKAFTMKDLNYILNNFKPTEFINTIHIYFYNTLLNNYGNPIGFSQYYGYLNPLMPLSRIEISLLYTHDNFNETTLCLPNISIQAQLELDTFVNKKYETEHYINFSSRFNLPNFFTNIKDITDLINNDFMSESIFFFRNEIIEIKQKKFSNKIKYF